MMMVTVEELCYSVAIKGIWNGYFFYERHPVDTQQEALMVLLKYILYLELQL